VLFCYVLLRWLLELVTLRRRSDAFKNLEIIVLRHELAIGSACHAPDADHGRRPHVPGRREPVAATRASAILHRHAGDATALAPRLVAKRWTYPCPVGRPPIGRETRALVLRLARENPRWGYPRIVGELKGLGIAVSATTVRTWLRAASLGPAGHRREMTWREFIKAHRQSLLAVDFFTVETI
jgi:hypothetical protein